MFTRFGRALALALLLASPVFADAYEPTLQELLGLSDVTALWGATQTSTLNSFFEVNGAVQHNVTWDATGEGFSRVVLQQGGFEKDLTGYDAFDFNVEAVTGDITIKPWIQTGENYDYFESTDVFVPEGSSSLVSFDLTREDLTNLAATRQFGYQVFGPASGDGEFLVSPAQRVTTRELPLFSFENDFEGWTAITWDEPAALLDISTDRGVTDGAQSLMSIKDKSGFAWTAEVTITPDSHPDAYDALSLAIESGGSLKYTVTADYDDGVSHPLWSNVFWDIVDDVGVHQLQGGAPGIPTSGAVATHLISFSSFDTPDIGEIIPESSSYLLRFATNGPAEEYATITTWFDNLAVVFTSAAVTGDFNGNGVLDIPDLDDLTKQSAMGTNPPAYDLNNDALVDEADIQVWVKDLRNGWIGDANLDGEFNSSDLVEVLASGTYEADVDSVWSQGDFNGDGRTNSTDLVAALADGGYEVGPRAAVAAVPEPSGILTTLWGVLLLAGQRRKYFR